MVESISIMILIVVLSQILICKIFCLINIKCTASSLSGTLNVNLSHILPVWELKPNINRYSKFFHIKNKMVAFF